ncbi:MAG: hypothetical protein CFH41_01406 [Alphaproteobacteria bacterium MarineAlpha11_Bin1]|nr:MAG: hypothetical protein CFH41_01406 [Alphaproteobacteria bacterium MarineAlpha11_Bin1]
MPKFVITNAEGKSLGNFNGSPNTWRVVLFRLGIYGHVAFPTP